MFLSNPDKNPGSENPQEVKTLYMPPRQTEYSPPAIVVPHHLAKTVSEKIEPSVMDHA